ncbi:MAG TPA: dTMP kinase [bacterium]|nr:dTMP kinase [bacterium]HPO11080.1 dTMP kinase [bacterium]HQL11589.1 dTMP kinase [bacterium]
MKNLFIAFEGPDGSGKGTQIELLKKYFKSKNIDVYFTSEPTSGPVGKFIKQALFGDFGLSIETLQTLFTADRIEHQKEINENLKKSYVITDRYYASTIAYIQTIDIDKQFLKEIIRLNFIQRRPDIWIYIRCTADESIASIRERKGKPEIYDNKEKIESILFNYDKFFKTQNNVIVVNRNGRTPEEINNELILKLNKIIVQ